MGFMFWLAIMCSFFETLSNRWERRVKYMGLKEFNIDDFEVDEVRDFERKEIYAKVWEDVKNFYFSPSLYVPYEEHSDLEALGYAWTVTVFDQGPFAHGVYLSTWELLLLCPYEFDRGTNMFSPWVPQPFQVTINPFQFYPYERYSGIVLPSKVSYIKTFLEQLILLPKNFIYCIFLSHVNLPFFVLAESLSLFFNIIEPLLELDFFNVINRWKALYESYMRRFAYFYLDNFDLQSLRKIDMGVIYPEFGMRSMFRDTYGTLPVVNFRGIDYNISDIRADLYLEEEGYYEKDEEALDQKELEGKISWQDVDALKEYWEEYPICSNLAFRNIWIQSEDDKIDEVEGITWFLFDTYESPVFRFRTGVEYYFSKYFHLLGHMLELDNYVALDRFHPNVNYDRIKYIHKWYRPHYGGVDNTQIDDKHAIKWNGRYQISCYTEYTLRKPLSYELSYSANFADISWKNHFRSQKFINNCADINSVTHRIAAFYYTHIFDPIYKIVSNTPIGMKILYLYTFVALLLMVLHDARMTDRQNLRFMLYHIGMVLWIAFYTLFLFSLYSSIQWKDIGEGLFSTYSSTGLIDAGYECRWMWGYTEEEMINAQYLDYIEEVDHNWPTTIWYSDINIHASAEMIPAMQEYAQSEEYDQELAFPYMPWVEPAPMHFY